MLRYLFPLILLLIISKDIWGQERIADIELTQSFEKTDYSVGYYDSLRKNYHLNLQADSKITRLLLDSSFREIFQYTINSTEISLKKEKRKRAGYITPLNTGKEIYEVYADKDTIFIIRPDFQLGKDSVIVSHPISQSSKDENLISIIPNNACLRVLTMSKKDRKLYLYQIEPYEKTSILIYPLPESNFGEKEKKLFTKDVAKVIMNKFDYPFTYHFPINIHESNFITPKLQPELYYSDTAIYLPVGMDYSAGISIIILNIPNKNVRLLNFFLNDLKTNMNAQMPFHYRSISTLIFDSVLVLKNASGRYFAYHFYDVNSGKEIKKYEASPNKELFDLIHSDLNQQGTWLSKKKSKDVENPKTFLRKSFGSSIYVSARTGDSLTISTLSYLYTPGIEGILLEFSTSLMGYAANIHIGNVQIIPYLYAERDKLIYAHSKFSGNTLEPSKARNITTFFDSLLEDFSSKDIASNSTFLLKKGQKYLMGVYDSKNHKFVITSYNE